MLTWASGAPLGAADEQLEALLDRASAYEIAFVGAFQNIVAEEVLVQQTSAPHRKRTLKSDFLFVNYPGIKGSIVLRDVFEVDGKPVRDVAQAERMMRLFTSPVRNAVVRAAELANEGARYNLWDIGTLNNPLIAMAFLQPDYRPRFRFNLAGMEKSLGPTVRTVRFQEWQLPTILRAGANNDLLARGLIWVDETNGRGGEDAAAGGQCPHPARNCHHLPPRRRARYRRACRDARLVSGWPPGRRQRGGDLRPLPAFRSANGRVDRQIGRRQSWTTPMKGSAR